MKLKLSIKIQLIDIAGRMPKNAFLLLLIVSITGCNPLGDQKKLSNDFGFRKQSQVVSCTGKPENSVYVGEDTVAQTRQNIDDPWTAEYGAKWFFSTTQPTCLFDCNAGLSYNGEICVESGTADANFGDNGVNILSLYDSQTKADNGKIIKLTGEGNGFYIAINHLSSTPTNNLVAQKVLANGQIDTSFGTNGFAEIPDLIADTSYPIYVQGMSVDQENNLFIAGYFWKSGGNTRGFLVKYNSNGVLDKNFADGSGCVSNGGGCIITDLVAGTATDGFMDVTIDKNGYVIALYYQYNGGGDYSFSVRKYNPENASLVTSFNSDGIFEYGVSTADYDDAWKLIYDAEDDKIYVIGDGNPGNGTYPIRIHRINNSDGSADTTYDDDGMVYIDLPADDSNIGWIQVRSIVEADDDGYFYFSGYATNAGFSYQYPVVGKLNLKEGLIDNTFDNDGYVDFGSFNPLSAANEIYPYDIIYDQTKESLYISNAIKNPTQYHAGIIKLNAEDGSLDSNWQSSGFYVRTPDGAGTSGYMTSAVLGDYSTPLFFGTSGDLPVLFQFVP